MHSPLSRPLTRLAASAVLALAAGPLMVVPSIASTSDEALQSAALQAVQQSLGYQGKNITVTAENGTLVLHGWVHGARQVSQARTVASTVPGATDVYSHLRVWSTFAE
ncbi:hypothetical protein os1_31010 [Comamonadaceae bacterium OS-1]|nr:hypothetical protein os1_31010 [Comamonadaceae bacterium OS-1]